LISFKKILQRAKKEKKKKKPMKRLKPLATINVDNTNECIFKK